MPFKFVHSADLHLDSPLRGLARYEGAPVERIRGATRRAFSNLVETCIEEEADLLLIAGDLFDGDWQDYSTGLFFVAELARLKQAGVDVIWVRGNHDAANKIRKSLNLPSNVREFSVRKPETIELEQLGVAVHGQGYRDADVREDLAAAYPRARPGLFNIGLLHTSLDGRPGHAPYASCTLERLIDHGYDYWALGHVHQREVVATEPLVVFPGNLQGRHAREIGPKGATIVSVQPGRAPTLEARALDVVRWEVVSVDATSSRHMDDVVERVQREMSRLVRSAEGRLLALRVMVSGATPAHAELERRGELFANQLRAAALEVGEGEVWIEKVVTSTRPDFDLAALRERSDALGELVSAFRRVAADEALLAEHAAALGELRDKLPTEILEDPDSALGQDPAALARLFDEAERLLLARLTAPLEPARNA